MQKNGFNAIFSEPEFNVPSNIRFGIVNIKNASYKIVIKKCLN